MPRNIRAKFMNSSAEKQKRYEQLYEQMYAESLKSGRVTIPRELKDPVERGNFLAWRHRFWTATSRAAAETYRHWLDHPPLALADGSSPSPSKT